QTWSVLQVVVEQFEHERVAKLLAIVGVVIDVVDEGKLAVLGIDTPQVIYHTGHLRLVEHVLLDGRIAWITENKERHLGLVEVANHPRTNVMLSPRDASIDRI